MTFRTGGAAFTWMTQANPFKRNYGLVNRSADRQALRSEQSTFMVNYQWKTWQHFSALRAEIATCSDRRLGVREIRMGHGS
jgi:hypothetical protein